MSLSTTIETMDSTGLDRDPNPASLEQLASQVQAGCSASFEELVQQSHQRVFQLLYQWCGNRSDAEDLTQDTYVKVWRSLPRYNPAQPFLPWIFTIARRTVVNHYRRISIRPRTEPMWESGEEHAAGHDHDQPDPASRLEARDDSQCFWEGARKLKENQFRVLWLHYAENLSVKETAQVMGISQVHVKVLLHRARKQLAQLIAPGMMKTRV